MRLQDNATRNDIKQYRWRGSCSPELGRAAALFSALHLNGGHAPCRRRAAFSRCCWRASTCARERQKHHHQDAVRTATTSSRPLVMAGRPPGGNAQAPQQQGEAGRSEITGRQQKQSTHRSDSTTLKMVSAGLHPPLRPCSRPHADLSIGLCLWMCMRVQATRQ